MKLFFILSFIICEFSVNAQVDTVANRRFVGSKIQSSTFEVPAERQLNPSIIQTPNENVPVEKKQSMINKEATDNKKRNKKSNISK